MRTIVSGVADMVARSRIGGRFRRQGSRTAGGPRMSHVTAGWARPSSLRDVIAPVVDAAWTAGHLEEIVPADVRWYLDGRPGRAEYDRGHLPGAVFVDLDAWLAAPASPREGRHPLPEPEVFARGMRELGIGDGDTVVAYDDQGGTVAARLVWMLRVTGHAAALLDGGIGAWEGPLETARGPSSPTAAGGSPPATTSSCSSTSGSALAGCTPGRGRNGATPTGRPRRGRRDERGALRRRARRRLSRAGAVARRVDGGVLGGDRGARRRAQGVLPRRRRVGAGRGARIREPLEPRRAGRPARRGAGRRQGPAGHEGLADAARLDRDRPGRTVGGRRAGRGLAAALWRRAAGEDDDAGARLEGRDGQRADGRHAQPVGPAADAWRLERRQRRGARGGAGAAP